ncbi:MAG: hypothetical protein HY062_01630 [Bacteroidetes bacterium]|nr:hypothetical protein [Bacteroidota bacterium]
MKVLRFILLGILTLCAGLDAFSAIDHPITARIQSSGTSLVTIGQPLAEKTVTLLSASLPYVDLDIKNSIVFGVDLLSQKFVPGNHTYKIVLDVKQWDKNNVMTQTPYTLMINYVPFDTAAYKVRNIISFKNAYKFTFKITSIIQDGIAINTLPEHLYIDGDTYAFRNYDFSSQVNTPPVVQPISPINSPSQVLDLDCDTHPDEIKIDWAPVPGAEEYQLEWTFINNYYAPTPGTTVLTYNTNLAQLPYDFKGNSTRITTTNHSYNITLAFDHGYIAYRVRAVGKDLTTGRSVFGAWSIPNSQGKLNTVSTYYYVSNPHETKKNWQYNATFAEEGKKKEVVSYFDGSLRNRQTVTKSNSDITTIVGENIYDNQGRPAISVMPVPVYNNSCTNNYTDNTSIKYYENFNTDDTLKAYSSNDFDSDNSTLDSCSSIVSPMSTNSGASRYYSANNPDKINQQAFVPDAKKYPFTQVEYTPDNTGRIRKQGGVGPQYQLGSNHETEYFYGQPNQIQIDRLFGSEVGDASHYKKNMVVDANGQVSVTYLDQEGRTIATALAGDVPKNDNNVGNRLDPISSSLTSSVNLTVDLFNKDYANHSILNTPNIPYDAIVFNSQLLVGYDSPFNFNYNMSVDTLGDICAKMCFNCIYNLKIEVKNDCGEDEINKQLGHPIDSLIGKFQRDPVSGLVNFISDCNSVIPYSGSVLNHSELFTLNLPKGNYTITKTLSINKAARDTFINRYLSKTYNSCFKSLDDFVADALSKVDTSDCYIDCGKMLASLGSRDDFVSSGKGTDLQYDILYEQIKESCSEKTYCQTAYEQLLADVSPSGQYGQIVDPTTGLIDAHDHWLSVYCTTTDNKLPKNFTPTQFPTIGYNPPANPYCSNVTNWKNPHAEIGGNTYNYYFEQDGSKSYVDVIRTGPPGGYTYSPEVDDVTKVIYDVTTATFKTTPDNLKYLADFVAKWTGTWAKSLVTYHPEFCYYKACITFSKNDNSGKTISSEDFDRRFIQTNTFKQAVDSGLIATNYLSTSASTNSKITSWFSSTNVNNMFDPFVTSSSNYSIPGYGVNFGTLLSNKFANYITIGGTNYSMAEFAAITARCGNLVGANPNPSCSKFGTDFIPGNAVVNDSIRNKEWSLLRNLYISAKQTIQKQWMDEYTKRVCAGCNSCIGVSDFNPFAAGIAYPPFNNAPFSNGQQPCNWMNAGYYVGRTKRFVNPTDNQNLDANTIAYQMYLQTGQCPNAFNFEKLLSGLAFYSKLTASSEALINYAEYTSLFLSNSNFSPTNFPANSGYTWMADPATVSTNQLEIKITDPVNNNPACTVKLTPAVAGTPINWNTIKSFESLTATGSGSSQTFNIYAVIPNPVGSATPNSYVLLKGAISCINLSDCNFKDECKPNQYALDISTMLSAIASQNQITATNLNLNVNTPYPYASHITPVIKAKLGVSSNNLRYNYNSGAGQIEIYENSNPSKKLLFKIQSSSPALTPALFASIAYFQNVKSKYQNFFTLEAVNINNIVLSTIELSSSISTSGNTVAVAMGDCDKPTSVLCKEKEHILRSQLEDLLNDVLVKKPFDQNSMNLINSSFYINPLNDFIKDSSSHYSCAKDSLIMGTSNCPVVLKPEHNITTPPYLLSDLVGVSNLTGIGNLDATGSYHDFYFIGKFLTNNTTIYDTVKGTSCIPLKNCIQCLNGNDTLPVNSLESANQTDIRNGKLITDPTLALYKGYVANVDSLNIKNGWTTLDSNYVTASSYKEFALSGYQHPLNSYNTFISYFDPQIDNRNLVARLDSFTINYGYATNCDIEYKRYVTATNNYNDKAISAGITTTLTALDDSTFYANLLCDKSRVYLRYLSAFPKGTTAALDLKTYLLNIGQLPITTDPCAILYQAYASAYSNFVKAQSINPTCKDYQKSTPLYSYNDFIKFNLCCQPNTIAIDAYILALKTATACPGPFPSFKDCNATPDQQPTCEKSWLMYQDYIKAYNNSAYAIAHNSFLDATLYTNIYSFSNAGLCKCIDNYLGYLKGYIGASAESNMSAPVNIDHYGPCLQNLPEPTDPCKTSYDKYLVAIASYNDFVKTFNQQNPKIQLCFIENIYKIEQFTANGYCYCVDEFVAFINAIINGSIVITEQNSKEICAKLYIGRTCDREKPCSQPAPVNNYENPPYVDKENPCVRQLKNFALANAQNDYDHYRDSLITDISSRYHKKCLSAFENYTTNYNDKEYHFTLYYYDQSGNLVRTVPPEGIALKNITSPTSPEEIEVKKDRANNTHVVYTQHGLLTTYEYNSLNQLVKQNLPDHDQMNIWDYTLPNGLDSRLKITATQFVNTTKGYLTGYIDNSPVSGKQRGYLYTSNDGGNTWQRLNDLTAVDLKKIAMVNGSTIGYAVGKDGIVLKTQDNGSTWDMLDIYGTVQLKAEFTDLIFTSATDGFIIGHQGNVIKTTNGGTNFSVSNTGINTNDTLTGITFNNASGGATLKYFISARNKTGLIYGSTNGNSWTPITSVRQLNFKKVQMLNANIGFAIADEGTLVKITGGTAITPVACGNYYTIRDFYFKKASPVSASVEGIAIIDSANIAGKGKIYKTFDGGQTWTLMSANGNYYNALYFYSNDKGIAVGDKGLMKRVVLTTAPFGLLSVNTPNKYTNLKSVWAELKAPASSGINDLYIEAVGKFGTTHKFYHGKMNLTPAIPTVTWDSTAAPASVNSDIVRIYADLFGPAANIGIAGMFSSQNGVMHSFRKPQGSVTYVVQPTVYSPASTTANIKDITGDNSTDAFAYDATTNKIYHATLNAASNAIFTLINTAITNNTNPINAIQFQNGNIACVGDNGEFDFANLNGTYTAYVSQNNISINSGMLPLNDIQADGTAGGKVYAIGTDGTIVRSVNAASTQWQHYKSGNANVLNSIKFISSVKNVIAGNKGGIYLYDLTLNTSVVNTPPVTNDLYDIGISSTNAISIVGQNGTVLYSSNVTNLIANPIVTLTPITNKTLKGVAFVGTSNSFISVGDNAYLQLNLANTVSSKINMAFTPKLNDVHFTTAQSGFVVGENYTVRYTTDGGNTWGVSLPNSLAGAIPSLNRVWTNKSGIAIIIGNAGKCLPVNFGLVGNNINLLTGTSVQLNGIAFNPNQPNNGVIVGASKTAFKINFNASTNIYSTAALPLITTGNFDFNAVHMFGGSSNDFIAVGTKSKVGYFDGTSWSNKSPNLPNTYSFNDVYFHDYTEGYIAGDNGFIYKYDYTTFINNPSITAPVAWIGKPVKDQWLTTNADSAALKITTINFPKRYYGFVGGYFNDGRVLADYARVLHDESEKYSTRFWYDRLGRMIMSQNTKQYNAKVKRYSYTVYDALGRIIEVGELSDPNKQFTSIFGTYINAFYNLNAIDDIKLNTFINGNPRKEVTHTYYDNTVTGLAAQFPTGFTQDNLRKRVATITYEDVFDNNALTYKHATHYSYDIHGNVKTILQDNPSLNLSVNTLQRFKRINYYYDLISGKVNLVEYAPRQLDRFYHKYSYDADNRIINVQTSRDSVIWDNDATYTYYKHGPLARVELGANKVQGIDYVYTLQGWIKGVNSNVLDATKDPGKDGEATASNPYKYYARDAFGYTLGYFNGDYEPIDNIKWSPLTNRFEAVTASSKMISDRNDLYNGNISHMVTTITEPKVYTPTSYVPVTKPLGNAYKYDQLNRLTEARTYDNLSTATNQWDLTAPTVPDRYLNKFTYDANGNIMTQLRKDSAATTIDNLTYNYATLGGMKIQNRLYNVRETVNKTTYTDDIDDQGNFNNGTDKKLANKYNNYLYDEIGNLRRDSVEQIDTIKWTVYGKIKEIKRKPGSLKSNLKFDYDAMGNRIAKHVYTSANVWKSSTYYNRDAQGNIMASYTQRFIGTQMSYKLTERDLYGSSMVGTDNTVVELYGMSNTLYNDTSSNWLGRKTYHGTNHLGNVLTQITDRKIPVDNNGDGQIDYFLADIQSSTDYHPFGTEMSGRRLLSVKAKYGMNGKEKDDEISGNGNSYDFGARQNDSRLGRWWSVDPKYKLSPQNSPYCFAANNPIYYIDADGNVIQPANEKSKQEYNSAVTKLFTGNDVVTKMLTVTGEATNIGSISREDYAKAMGSLNDPDQRAAFHGLYLAANSQKVYNVQVVGEGETATVGGKDATSGAIRSAGGVTYSQDANAPVTDVAISTESEGALRAPFVTRDKSAMIVGGILTAFIKTDPFTNDPNENFTYPNTDDPGLVQIQNENVVRRATGLGEMSGTDFQKPSGEPFNSKELKQTSKTPDQIKYIKSHSTREVKNVDVTKTK